MGANNQYGSGIPVALQWSGGDSKTVTPTAAVQTHQCELRALPLKERKFNLVAMRIVCEVELLVNQPGAGGAVINTDKLAKAITSFGLRLPEIGYYFSHDHTPGALHHNVFQVLANGYRKRGISDAAVPAADGNYSRTLRYELPFALPLLADELDTAMPMALLEGGVLEVKVAENTVFGTDSTGATLDSVVLRSWIEAIPVSKMWVPGLYGQRIYGSAGGVASHRLEGLGSGQGLGVVEEGSALGAVYMICNPTGLGLGGSGTADNVVTLNSPDLDIPDLNHLAALYEMLERQIDAEQTDAVRWPYSNATTVFGNGKVAGALILPIRMPTRGQLLSRLRRFNAGKRDLRMKYGFTATPSGEMKHGTLEFYKPKKVLEDMVRDAYKIDPSWQAFPAPVSGKPLTDSAVHATRYGSRQVFRPQG